jgi:hypothetical protein
MNGGHSGPPHGIILPVQPELRDAERLRRVVHRAALELAQRGADYRGLSHQACV